MAGRVGRMTLSAMAELDKWSPLRLGLRLTGKTEFGLPDHFGLLYFSKTGKLNGALLAGIK